MPHRFTLYEISLTDDHKNTNYIIEIIDDEITYMYDYKKNIISRLMSYYNFKEYFQCYDLRRSGNDYIIFCIFPECRKGDWWLLKRNE